MGSAFSTEPPKDQSLTAFHPTPSDVFAVRAGLTTRLPPELADLILELARYWPRILVENNEPVKVQNDDTFVYLASPPIQGYEHRGVEIPIKIRLVRFMLASQDQGWGGEQGDHNTYGGSWTWFEAAILRGDHPISLGSLNAAQEALPFVPCLNPVLDTNDGAEKHLSRWFLQGNLTASSIPRRHIIEWASDDADLESAGNGIRHSLFLTGEEEKSDAMEGTQPPDVDGFRGITNGSKSFMETLQPGDRIVVLARAMFPGWVNEVHCASVEIFYSV